MYFSVYYYYYITIFDYPFVCLFVLCSVIYNVFVHVVRGIYLSITQYQSINQSINPPINRSLTHSLTQSWSINQSSNQSINQSINQIHQLNENYILKHSLSKWNAIKQRQYSMIFGKAAQNSDPKLNYHHTMQYTYTGLTMIILCYDCGNLRKW